MRTPLAPLLALMWLGASAVEAPKPIEELFHNMRKAYAAVGSADLKAKIKRRTSTGEQTGIFSVKFAQPNKLRFVAEVGSVHLERYCNGRSVVTIQNENRFSDKRVDVASLTANLPGNLEWLCLLDWKRQLSTTPPKGQKSGGNTMAVCGEPFPDAGLRWFDDPALPCGPMVNTCSRRSILPSTCPSTVRSSQPIRRSCWS